MSRIDYNIHLSFKDILLVPFDKEICTIKSRNDPDISSNITPSKRLEIPIISSPMDTISQIDMCVAMGNAGGLGVHTRHINDPDELSKQVFAVKTIKSRLKQGYVAVAIGAREDADEKARALLDAGAEIIVIDIANANSVHMFDSLNKVFALKNHYDNLSIIAGNVATPEAAIRLSRAGADAIKVGIGPGGACTTRRVTGFGYPQLEAVMNCAEALYKKGYNHYTKIIGDGGIRSPGDVVKCLWAGADAVMLGYVLAGHTECPLISDEQDRKEHDVATPKRWYRGMSSRTVSGRSDVAAEGVEFEVPFRGNVENTIKEYAAGIRSGMTFANAKTLDELRKNVTAIRVSTLSQNESDPVSE